MKKLLLVLLLMLLTTTIYSQNLDNVRFSYSGRDTCSVADTISRKVLSTSNSLTSKYGDWFQGIFATDDTIQISTDTNYTNSMILYPDESILTPKYNIRYFYNLYWRVLGTGVANVRYYLFGN